MSAPSKQEIRKVVLASLLGATIEWYDFFLYGVVAGIVFNKLFFPTTDPFIGTILAYSTFAIGLSGPSPRRVRFRPLRRQART